MISVNPKMPKPLYEQIIDNIKELVIKGILTEGDPIPSVRKLAIQIDVNPNTISKAYRELERQKIIETIQGKGTFIASNVQRTKDETAIAEIKEKCKPIFIQLKYLQLSDEEIMQMVTSILEEIRFSD